MSVFGTRADRMFRYFVCPNDKFVLNSLEETDRDGIVYRILKAENYQRILFVENDGSNYKIFAYDTLSELSYKHSDEFKKIDISNPNSIKAFYEKTQGKQTKNNNGPAGLNLGLSPNLFGKKNDDNTSAKRDSSPEYGRRVVADFSKAEDFLAIFIKLLDALEYDKVQTAIVMQMDLLARVNSPKVKDFMDKARSAHTGKNILLYVAEKKELLSNIVKRDEIHYLHPMLLEFFESSRCDNGSADVIEELLQRNIIVVADKIGSDEVANCILRQKIIKKDIRFENIPVSKVYSLAELLVEDLLNINEKKHFKHIPEKVDNYISFLSGCLDDDSFIKTLEEKCKELCPREIALVRDNNVLHLERISHKDSHFSVMSESEKNKNYVDTMGTLNSMIGLQPVKDELNSIFDTITVMGKDPDAWYSYIFAGNPGTGKTQVARLMGQMLKTIGVLEKGHVVEVTKSDIVAKYTGQSGPKTRDACEKALGGVLFLDEAYELVKTDGYGGETFADDFCKEAYNTIMNFMYNHRGEICFVFAGYPQKMERFIKADPGMQRRISKTLYFPDYSIDELYSIFEIMANKSGFKLADNVRNVAITRIKDIKSGTGDNFGNAGEMEKLLAECKRNIAARITKQLRNNSSITPEERYVILPEDLGVDTESVGEEAFNIATKELYELIGLQSVKEQITLLMNQIKYSSGNDSDKEPGHYVFAGNPGTGKTVVARLMGKIFKAIGVLPKGHVVEVSKATLVAGYVGQTQGKVQELCESALGGVLFVDEAYQLFSGENSGADFGKEAIEVIMKFMEDNRKNVSVIFAGYEDKMNELYKVNSGLDSRISKTIRFPDYTSEELLEILKLMMTKKELTAEADFFEKAYKYIVDYKKNKFKDFGNAREIRKILNDLDQNKARRLAIKEQNGENITKKDKMTLTIEDFDIQQSKVDRSAFEKAMAPLNELIGLQSVKERVISISNHVENQVARETENRVAPGHYVFSGNPGTGKTEVAKLMGEIFKALGVLKRGHVVSVKASDMIGKFQGDVEEKTTKLCEQAIEGVFFLDEAYSLVNCSEGATGYADENCRKIYEKIMTFMEENKNRVSFIFAGYKDEMRKFIGANPGMSSRIGDNIIDFPDYSVDELYEIFVMMCQKEKYNLSDGFKDVLLGVFKEKKKNGGNHFGNARMVREVLVKTTHNQSDRIARQIKAGENISVEDRNILLPVDINGEVTDVGENAFEQAMTELNKMIGLGAVKNKIKSLFNKEKYSLDENSAIKTPGHYIFAGNPGTGKTEVAKLMGKIFRSMGLLKTDNLIRVAPADLIGRFYGDTENITKQKCLDALGGILFVDEAYQLAGQGTLTNGDSTYGTKALETIMDFMTEHKTNLCVIFAGYEQEMEKIFATNPGFKSRFRETIVFPDYSTEELIEIFKLKISKKLVFAERFIEKLEKYFDWQKSLAPNNFGNGRAVEQAVEKIMEYRGNRLEALSNERKPSETDIYTLMPEDIPDIQIEHSMPNKELGQKSFRKISKKDIENMPISYEPQSYTKQEISTVIDKSILFVRTDAGCGTAFLISPDGYAVTCNHVIEGARQINARLRIPGRIGGADSWHECTVINTRKDIDIAVIKLTGSNFPYLNMAKPERKIVRGEDFVLMGYPFGNMTANDPTMFPGSISSSENQMDENGYKLYYINSEAKCGHSGSPIVSLSDGCVIGVLLGSITNQSGELIEEINYMRPITYLWEEFME